MLLSTCALLLACMLLWFTCFSCLHACLDMPVSADLLVYIWDPYPVLSRVHLHELDEALYNHLLLSYFFDFKIVS